MKKNKWLTQSSGFTSSFMEEQFNTLKSLEYNVDDFGLQNGTNRIFNIENFLDINSKYIIRGGTKILTLLNNIDSISDTSPLLSKEDIENSNIHIENLRDGIDYSVEKFDILNYSKLELPLLNDTAKYLSYEELKDISYKDDMFIKPSKDLKAFDGGIIKKNTTIKDYILGTKHQSFYKDETIVINRLKEIYSEYRFFIINGEVITGSLYMMGSNFLVDSNVPKYILDTAKEYAKLYNPSEIFVMDLADTPKGAKIIEYNCWNASGLYGCNIQKLFSEVNEFKKEK